MSATLSRIIGIASLVLSVGSAVVAVLYFSAGRTKHGLLFAAIFVILLLFGLITVRAKAPAAGQAK
jgi:hypothetical protein